MKKRKMKKTKKIDFGKIIKAATILLIATFAIYAIVSRIAEINEMNCNLFSFLLTTMRQKRGVKMKKAKYRLLLLHNN